MSPPPKRRDLTQEKIIDAALAVMRTEGADKITMRRIAEACGTTAMALYHHVPNKAELVTRVVDSLFLDVARAPRRGDGWRAQLEALWLDARAKLLEIPGAGEVFIRQPVVGPGTALLTEEMFRLLHEGGVTGADAPQAADALTMLAIGSIANELTRPARIREQLPLQLPDTPTPHMDRHIAPYATRDGTDRYRVALTWLLDGIDPGKRR